MDFQGFTLFPSHPRRSVAEPEDQRIIGEILEREGLLAHVPEHKAMSVELHNPVPAGASLVQAHGDWTPAYFPELETLEGFPRQPDEALCPHGLVKLSVECVTRGTGGMSSHYGFEGYYLSVLVSVAEGRIWDVRGEPAA